MARGCQVVDRPTAAWLSPVPYGFGLMKARHLLARD